MSAAQKRTLYRFVAVFLAAGGADAIIQFSASTTYDWHHLIAALFGAGFVALEKILSENNPDVAAPTVTGVNVALAHQKQLGDLAPATVPPPTLPIEPEPRKPFDTL